jgi:hypothetical protein
VDKVGGDSEQKDERDITAIDAPEYILGILAAGWYGYHTEGKHDRAQDIASLYQVFIKVMWDWGWRGNHLLPDDKLPEEHMPAYFVQYWVEYHKNRH